MQLKNFNLYHLSKIIMILVEVNLHLTFSLWYTYSSKIRKCSSTEEYNNPFHNS